MPSNTLLSLASAVLVAVPYVEAQILSCADVECPINPGTTSAKCTVVDKTFNAVGVAELSTDLDDFKKLSWVKAVGAEDGSTDSVYDQTFYLGTPEGFSFSGTGACALFFSEVSSEVKFGDGDARMTTGTCKEALSDDCVSALVDRAKAVDLKGLSNTDACAKLQRDFSDNLDSACSKFATGKSWAGIRAQALSGNGSPEPISEKQNATSNCWPIVPKADGLRVVESINVTGDLQSSTLMKNFFSITPILTVFFPGNGTAVSKSEAQLTCLKTIDLTTASAATMSGEDKDNGTADRLFGRAVPAVWVGLVSVMFAVLLG